MTDIIEAMASPNVDATAGTNAVVENAIACSTSGNIGSNYVQMIISIVKLNNILRASETGNRMSK